MMMTPTTTMMMLREKKVTFEGAFDVFRELCLEYWGQLRSHLGMLAMIVMMIMVMIATMIINTITLPISINNLVEDLLDITLGLGGTPECRRAPTPSLVLSSLGMGI